MQDLIEDDLHSRLQCCEIMTDRIVCEKTMPFNILFTDKLLLLPYTEQLTGVLVLVDTGLKKNSHWYRERALHNISNGHTNGKEYKETKLLDRS